MVSGSGGANRRASSYRSKPYRKYRPLPALIVIAVLGLVAGVVWINAITETDDLNEAAVCTPKPDPPEGVTYEPLPLDALSDVPFTPPDRIAVRVLNAGGERGQATMTTLAMRQLGFTQIAEPENDPAYKKAEANCHGQLRFGENGEGAARTVSLIDPCLQLVRDNRKDATVDLAIGTAYNDTHPSAAARDILDQLEAWSAKNKGTAGGEQSTSGHGPDIDQSLIDKAAPTRC